MQSAGDRIRELIGQGMNRHGAGRLDEAEAIYRQALQIEPENADALHLLGVIAHQRGRNDLAAELIGRAIGRNDRVPAFHNNLGNALNAAGRFDAAAAAYRRAIALQPDHAGAHYNLGVLHQAGGRLDEAAAAYEQALRFQPGHVQASANLGAVRYRQGRLDDAAACYERALARAPGFAEAQLNLGNVRKAQGRFGEAEAAYRRALGLRPDLAEAHDNLGVLLFQRGELDAAAAAFEAALRGRPDLADAWANLGAVRYEQGRGGEALEAYGRALALDPDLAKARLGRAIAAIPVFPETAGQSRAAPDAFEAALDELAGWSRADPARLAEGAGVLQPFYLAYRPSDVSRPLCRFGDLMASAAKARWPAEDLPARSAGPGRLRLAIVCGQVRRHPVWDVILRGLIEHLDRTAFELLVFHTGAITDAETAWARERADLFVQGALPFDRWLQAIAEARPDIILYPEVGMDPAVGALATLRLAPLQVAAWGHPVTTGLPEIDLFLSGELIEAEDAGGHYRERLVRLPGTGVCTRRPDADAAPWRGPPRPGGVVRFALCQQPMKFDPADDELLAMVAEAAGPCELWLVTPHKLDWAAARLKDRLAVAFRGRGLDPEAHLRATPWMAPAEFNGFLDEMDALLDCPAFSGYTTAWQALHRGLPVLTLEGPFLRQRLAAGLLRQIGLADQVTHSREQYLEAAVDLTRARREPGAWSNRRASIRAAAAQADGNVAAVRELEQALIEGVRGQSMGSRKPTPAP